ncbi:transporter substrate-binding domain-containing protein [Endozoicomonas sp. SM1973]|uniref:Transporter substrate-binding domain-containing protein n=1 Tax=Spartinivicinus marinus TaxID=2994442 RepID=A0A853I0G0_9GAMM|nr:transporter substrate-binding domain-containing protein [Spartinivicinus marinus]MCX4029894.1 transporter substrate-binding domain-containing protein [Spartinivicinus marinus]NYZ64862.1 transporter substrate-binding domain-containing protein [Spartinivicinus marinus]
MKPVITLLICLLLSYSICAEKIRVATSDWPPFYSPTVENDGILTYIVKETLKPLGHSLTVDFLPWARALALTKVGKYHALLGCWHTKAREDYYYFTKKMLDAGPHFIKKQSEKLLVRTPSDLENLKVGVIRNFALSDTLINSIKEKKTFLVEVDSIEQLFELIEYKRVDLILENPLVLKYQYRQKFPKLKYALSSAGPDFKNGYIYVCWSKKMPGIKKIVDDYDKSFEQVFKDQRLTEAINDLFQ